MSGRLENGVRIVSYKYYPASNPIVDWMNKNIAFDNLWMYQNRLIVAKFDQFICIAPSILTERFPHAIEKSSVWTQRIE